LRDQNWISAYYGHRGFEIALTHKKSLAGTVRNYNWKIFACLVGFGNVFAEDRVSRGALDGLANVSRNAARNFNGNGFGLTLTVYKNRFIAVRKMGA
jgi:hypothetical protein